MIAGRGSRFIDRTGLRYARLTALRVVGSRRRTPLWECRCDCGAIRVVPSNSLSSGSVTSCGCLRREKISKARRRDLLGHRFNRLLVVSFAGLRGDRVLWRARCDCGGEVVTKTGNLVSGHTQSCGCYNRERTHATNFNPALPNEERTRNRGNRLGVDSWQNLRGSIFARDDYTCLCCGARGGRLAAHHIIPWHAEHDLRYARANLVSLCVGCHAQFHELYGHDCDLDDLEEFLYEDCPGDIVARALKENSK